MHIYKLLNFLRELPRPKEGVFNSFSFQANIFCSLMVGVIKCRPGALFDRENFAVVYFG